MEERLIAIVAAALRVPTSTLTLETGPGDLQRGTRSPRSTSSRRSRRSSGFRFPLSRWQRSDTSAIFSAISRRHHEMRTPLQR